LTNWGGGIRYLQPMKGHDPKARHWLPQVFLLMKAKVEALQRVARIIAHQASCLLIFGALSGFAVDTNCVINTAPSFPACTNKACSIDCTRVISTYVDETGKNVTKVTCQCDQNPCCTGIATQTGSGPWVASAAGQCRQQNPSCPAGQCSPIVSGNEIGGACL
jgi:hypothetical protein